MRVLQFILGLAVVAGALMTRAVAHEQTRRAERYEDRYYLPPPGWLEVLSLGHREALADLLWCRALVYLGEEFTQGGTLDNVFRYTDSMLALDPDFLAVYRWISIAGVYQPSESNPEEIRRSLAIMERGRARFPDDGRLAWVTGATWTFELAPLLPQAEQAETRLRGIEHLMDAVRLRAAPEWVLLTSTTMLRRFGETERLLEQLEGVYATVQDDATRTELAYRIQTTRDAAYGNAFVEANDAFEAARLSTLPYVHPSLYFLLHDEPPTLRLTDGVFSDEAFVELEQP